MKNTYKVGDWVNACNWKSKIYQNKTFKISKISKNLHGDTFLYVANTTGDNCFDYSVRPATNEEIIKAGGKPNKIELNYEIY
ncbi:MAG: hypothetical protein HRT87_09755 [Legionellales bacterium]|nr:hypothetical protein [Legionellales bacterium]